MATAASHVQALERWDSLSNDDKIKQQEEISNELEKPMTVQKFTEACKTIGEAAAAVDRAFENVKIGFDDIVRNYGQDFPEVKDYAAKWVGYKQRWGSPDGLLWSSRKLATFTASQLDIYNNVFLDLVEKIKSEEDVKDAQENLRYFATKEHPVDVNPEIADGFKNLRTDIQGFTKDFQRYFIDKKQELEKEAIRLQGVIEKLLGEIETVNGEIDKILIGLACSVVFGIVGVLIVTAVLNEYISDREDKEKKLAEAQSQLDDANRKQKALAHMQSDFDRLKPDIELICVKLGMFAEVWASARSQAVDFANKLDMGLKVTTEGGFKATLRLARATCKPLREGLKAYAKTT